MNCSEISRILDDHGLSALRAAERASFDAHLADCDHCYRAVLAHEALAKETSPSPRPGLWSSIVEDLGLPAVPRAGPRAPLGWQALGGLAAMGALVLLAVLSTPGREGVPPSAVAGAGGAVAGPAAGQIADSPGAAPGGAAFVAGVDFVELASLPVPFVADELPGRVGAWLFYLWSCLHCYELDALFSEWSDRQDAAEVLVARVPVQWNAYAELHARAFYTAEVLGLDEPVSDAFFTAVHEDGNSLETREAIRALFSRLGIGGETFDSVFDSAGVETRLERGRALAAAFGIDATPAIVVAGRYKTSPALAGTHERMLAIADWLIDRAGGAGGGRDFCDPVSPNGAREGQPRFC